MSNKWIGKKFGNYVVTSLLGQGGMAEVYLAKHPQIGRRVAIKLLAENLCFQKEVADRFIAEAKAVTRIRHPNIIDIYDFGWTEQQRPYYVMELLEGHELKKELEDRQVMSPAEILPYLKQICAALQAAHDCGIVHRDLSPANIFVLDQEPLEIKILDFGLAKLLERDHTQHEDGVVTVTGMIMGSPVTIAPEQAAGRPQQIGPHTDLYSLGVILYWMLSGRPPFQNEPVAVMFAKHINEPPPPLAEVASFVPSAVAAVVEKCLEKDPANRPASAAEIYASFAEAAEVSLEPEPQLPAPARMKINLPTGEMMHTTLRGATGELAASMPRNRAATWLTLSAVGLGVIAVGFFLARGVTKTPAQVEVTETRAPSVARPQPSKPVVLPEKRPPVLHTVEVIAEIPGARCEVRIGSGPARTLPAPCRLQVASGQLLHLEVGLEGYRSLTEELVVTGDKSLVVKKVRRGRRLVWAAKMEQQRPSPPKAATPARRKIARRKKATRAQPAPPPKRPTVPVVKDTPPPKKKLLGEGTVDL